MWGRFYDSIPKQDSHDPSTYGRIALASYRMWGDHVGAIMDRSDGRAARRIARSGRSLDGWTSERIAAAFCAQPDSVRHWRWIFGREGVAGLRARKAPGPEPVKARAALSVIEDLLAPGVSDRPNWTLPRLADEIEKRTGERISKSRLSVVVKKGASPGAGRATR